MCSRLFWAVGNVLLQRNPKHMSPIHFTHVEYYYFLGRGEIEKLLVISAEWNVIALLLQLSRCGRKQPFQERKMFSRRHSGWQAFPSVNTPLQCQSILSCTITTFLPLAHKHIHFPHLKKSLPKLPNTDSLAALFSLKTQLASKTCLPHYPPAYHITIPSLMKTDTWSSHACYTSSARLCLIGLSCSFISQLVSDVLVLREMLSPCQPRQWSDNKHMRAGAG